MVRLQSLAWQEKTRSSDEFTAYRLGWPVSDVWLLPDAEGGPVLVDSGFWTGRAGLLLGMKSLGVNPRDLKGVVLTHRHLDHAGNAEWFSRTLGVPVYAHRADAEVLKGGTAPVRLQETVDFVGALSVLENRVPARVPEVLPLEEGDTVAGLEVISMPGHTLGSVFLYHRQSATLFTGDMLLNAVPPYVAKTALSLPYPHFSDNYPLAIESLRRYLSLDLPVRRICPGHGPSRLGPIAAELAELLAGVKDEVNSPDQRA